MYIIYIVLHAVNYAYITSFRSSSFGSDNLYSLPVQTTSSLKRAFFFIVMYKQSVCYQSFRCKIVTS